MTYHSMNTQQVQPIMRQWRIIFLVWIIATIISTGFGLSSILTSPMHPIYFVLASIIPSTLFLIISLITTHSIFSQLFLWLKNIIFKNKTSSSLQTELPIRYIIQLVSNITWTTVLLTSIGVLLFKFTFQHFDFYLGNTFTESKTITQQLIQLLNFLPEKLGLSQLSNHLIDASFISNGLTDSDRSVWAKWVIVMILFYGLLPRALVLTYYGMRSFLYSAPQTIISQAVILDAAIEKSLVIRAPKAKVRGEGSFQVALDITDQIRLSPNVIKLNDIETFQQFELTHKSQPISKIEIFLDGNLMPDRGLLRRLIRLLNLSEQATIHIVTQDAYQKSMWQQHLSSVLVEGEIANYEIK